MSSRPVQLDSPGVTRETATAFRLDPRMLRILRRRGLFGLLLAALWFALQSPAAAQPRPYIGFVYPAGGQQGTTFQIRLGGQGLDDVQSVSVTGPGVTARIADNYRRLNNQEMQLLNEQLRALRRETMSESARADVMVSENATMTPGSATNAPATNASAAAISKKESARELMDKIEKRTHEFVQTPASAAIASLVLVEVTIAPDAGPGAREIRLVTLRGVSNPLGFHVGQVPEYARTPMVTAIRQVLGKESQALRRRPPGEEEERVTLPCTVNGQIASGEVNRYRFEAHRGQRLVITTLGRQLVPFIADAVPGWFQPVLALYDAAGKEVAYADDYRFKPDPTLSYEVPKDGAYVFTIHDSLYRGREDFVYRITAGELPFITSIFPLGRRAAADEPASGPSDSTDRVKSAVALSGPELEFKGWNLDGAKLLPLPADARPGTYSLAADRKGFVSNRVPFALDDLPEALEREPNNTPANAQEVTLPVLINGRIDRPDDWDVFRFAGKSNETVVAEVRARRLDSPLDSVLKLTDAAGNLVAFNDDHEDLTSGLNTHQADSYLMTRLPADGEYYVHIGDTARQGGEAYGYRLRISAPRPDFDLRAVPSSLSLRAKSAATLTVYAQRKDGFTGPIRLALKDPPEGFSAPPVTLSGTQTVARLNIRTTLSATPKPVALSVVGTAKLGDQALVHEAVPAEDQMQAFLWRHLVPAQDLQAFVFEPTYRPPLKRVPPTRRPPAPLAKAPVSSNTVVAATSAVGTNAVGQGKTTADTNALAASSAAAKAKFTKQQVAARLRQIKLLFEEGMLTDDFYVEKVAESEAEE